MLKKVLKKILPKSILRVLRKIREYIYSIVFILLTPKMNNLSYIQRVLLAYRLERVSWNVACPHTKKQVWFFIEAFMAIPSEKEGCVVEAGVYKGGSTSKFSIGTKLSNRQLVAFDSFQGMPKNEEPHDKEIGGESIKDWFKEGTFNTTLDEVKNNVERFGEIDVCAFMKGWFKDTMPRFSNKICALYLDVDLAASTKTCLKYLYPQVIPGGVVFSQDGNFPLVIEVFNDDEFWEKEVGCKKPYVEGLGEKKLIKIIKPS